MLSVLTNSTWNLIEELEHTREEATRLQTQNKVLHDLDEHRRDWLVSLSAPGSCRRAVVLRDDFNLKRFAFVAFVSCWRQTFVWKRGSDKHLDQKGQGRCSAVHWLWRRKVVNMWRRASLLSSRSRQHETHKEEVDQLQTMVTQMIFQKQRLEAELLEERKRCDEFEQLVERQKRQNSELHESMLEARTRTSEYQATLKECYKQHFEDTKEREKLEHRHSLLVGDLCRLRNERGRVEQQLTRKCDEVANLKGYKTQCDMQLGETSGQLTRVETALNDILGDKCNGLNRLFEKYDMPGVLLSLFRKVVELQWHTREKQAFMFATSCSSLPESPTINTSKSSSTLPSTILRSSSSETPLEAEVRHHVPLYDDRGSISRNALHTYLEKLQLTQVSAGMAAQVILALLGLDLGTKSCEVPHFIELLSSPPTWEQLNHSLSTNLWGAVRVPSLARLPQGLCESKARLHAGGLTSPRSQLSSVSSLRENLQEIGDAASQGVLA